MNVPGGPAHATASSHWRSPTPTRCTRIVTTHRIEGGVSDRSSHNPVVSMSKATNPRVRATIGCTTSLRDATIYDRHPNTLDRDSASMQKKTNPKPFKVLGGAKGNPLDFPSLTTYNHLVTLYEEYASHRSSADRPPVPQGILDEYKFDINMDDFKYERTSNGCAWKATEIEANEMMFTVSLRRENGGLANRETHRRLIVHAR